MDLNDEGESPWRLWLQEKPRRGRGAFAYSLVSKQYSIFKAMYALERISVS
jgi:hypothetical protein